MFPLPLSLGVASDCELMDFGMDMTAGEPDFDDLKEKLNAALPEGLEIVRLYEPKSKHTEIAACDYTLKFICEKPSEEILRLFDSFLSQEGIYIEKRCKVNMKKTIVTIDIKPDISVRDSSSSGGYANVRLRLPAGIKHSLNVVSVANAFEEYCGFEFDKICINRTRILSESEEDFT